MSYPIPIPRQQIPQDSLCQISDIHLTASPIVYQNIFQQNDRRPQNQNDQIQPIMKWVKHNQITQSHTYDNPILYKVQPGKVKGVPSKWTDRTSHTKDKSIYLSLNFGQQKKINQVSLSNINNNNFSFILNKTTPIGNSISSYCGKQYKSFIHQSNPQYKIFKITQPKSNSNELELYKIEHECNIIFNRLLTIQASDRMLPYQISSLRRQLILAQNIIGRNKQLQHKYKLLITQIQNVLHVSSKSQQLLDRIQHIKQTTLGVVRNLYSSNQLMKLVKIISVKKLLKSLETIQQQFQILMNEKSYIDRSNVILFLQTEIKDNIIEIQEVLELHNEESLRNNIKLNQKQIIDLMKTQIIFTQIQKQVILDLGSSL